MTVQGPVKKQQPNGMSHRGGGGVAVTAMPLVHFVSVSKATAQS